MPNEPPDPGIVQNFVNAVANCSWSNNHLVDPLSGAARYPAVASSRIWPTVGQWDVKAAGSTISQATYNLIKNSTANADGSFTAASGSSYWLANQAGVAVEVPK